MTNPLATEGLTVEWPEWWVLTANSDGLVWCPLQSVGRNSPIYRWEPRWYPVEQQAKPLPYKELYEAGCYKELYEAGCKTWNPVYQVVLKERDTLRTRISELEGALEKIQEYCSTSSHPHCLETYKLARATLRNTETDDE